MARFLYESKALFLHIPRTGGTTVERVLSGCQITTSPWIRRYVDVCKKHSLLMHYSPQRIQQVEFAFAFVRHPVGYYSSVWRYLRDAVTRNRDGFFAGTRWHPFRDPLRLFCFDFDRWVDAMVREEPAWATRLYELYAGPEGGEWCDYIGRTESLADDLVEVLTRLGHDPPDRVPSVHGTRTPRFEVREETAAKIAASEAPAVRRFYSPPNEGVRWYGGGTPACRIGLGNSRKFRD